MNYLAKEGYNPQYGARPLKRLIQSKILTPIAGLMISRGLSKGGTITVDMKGGEFAFSVKKGKNGSFVSDGFVAGINV
jgi:ATP-dependent Clp protease ATP-binding subunit ClpA